MKRLNTTAVIGILIGAVALACLVSGLIIFLVSNSRTDPSKTVASSAATADEITTAAPQSTAAATSGERVSEDTSAQPETADIETDTAETSAAAAPPSVPEDLQALLDAGGCSEEALTAAGAGQLIVVNASGTSAQLTFYEKSDGVWTNDSTLTCQGNVGSQGTMESISEQTTGTPKGFYAVGDAFYQYDAPATGLNTFRITDQTYWVDDPDSQYYNQRVEGTENRDWNSAEHMSAVSNYKYGFVINYNMPAAYNKGSAIFFHIGSTPTLGCVSASEDMVLAYLARLSAAENPYILII